MGYSRKNPQPHDRTGVLFVWECATAEQAMCMEAHHIKMARLKAIIAIILLDGLGEYARDLTKNV